MRRAWLLAVLGLVVVQGTLAAENKAKKSSSKDNNDSYRQERRDNGINLFEAMGAAQRAGEQCGATGRELLGVAAAAGTAGMMLAGPWVALAGAVGGAYVAATGQGEAGEIARSTGRLTANMYDKAMDFETEHKVKNKVSELASNMVNKAKQLNKEHHIVERAKQDTITVMKAAQELNEKHGITDKVAQCLVNGLDYINNALKDDSANKRR